MLKDDDFAVGQQFPVTMHWRMADRSSVWAGFIAEVSYIDVSQMRLLSRLTDIQMLRTSLPPTEADQEMLEVIRGLVGQYAFLPYEAADGTKLNLKLTTLTGEHPYFFGEKEYKARKNKVEKSTR